MELSKYIGKKIKARREHLNITQDELAEMMNTSRVTITRYENGSRKANQDALFELAKLLNVSISYLLHIILKPLFLFAGLLKFV